jgi:hypothetical protein
MMMRWLSIFSLLLLVLTCSAGHPDKDKENPKADDNFVAIAGGLWLLDSM